MRIRKSFEQAICILLLIGTNDGPLKSHELSKKLDVSDSYLKKVTRQLVVAGLITSKASKLGGFILNKKMNDIFKVFISMSLSGSLLILALLVLRHFLKSKIMRLMEASADAMPGNPPAGLIHLLVYRRQIL